MITKYGIDVVVRVVALAAVVAIGVWLLSDKLAVRIPVLTITGFLVAFTLYFFRDPDRVTPGGDNLVVSPADGKIVLISDAPEDEFLKQRAKQISIFMSPLNVHVNRFPFSGKVQYYKYIPGKYFVAFEEKSSQANERTHIGIENGKFKVFFRQIAGFIARRIVADVDVGMHAVAGARFGMIKFGSRVDVLLPASSEVTVELNDRVVGGETVLAVLK